MRIARTGFAIVAFAVITTAGAGTASAYPQWQFSSGTARCSQCHFAPAGGGIITGYARDAVGDDLSTWSGNGAFAHGAAELPKWLALQFDGRGAFLVHDVGDPQGATVAAFPMQTDLSARAALSDVLSVTAVLGYRGQVRPGADDAPILPAVASRFISREHYLTWRPAAIGMYLRAGRFFAPFGLRLAEHTTYVRRDTGFNLLEETYGLSGGVVKNEYEFHVTAFVPDFWRGIGGREKGATAMFEQKLGGASAVGLGGRAGFGDDSANRYIGNVFAKTYFEGAKTLLQGEADIIHSTFSVPSAGTPSTDGFAGYFGATVFPVKGLWVTPFVERRQTSLSVRDSATNGAGGQINWFPLPHWEATLFTQIQKPAGQQTAKTMLFFLHYYL